MKTSFFFVAFLFCTVFAYSQLLPSVKTATTKPNVIKNGTIYYKMTVEGEESQAKMMHNSTYEFAFSGKDSKLSGLVMGGLFSGNLIVDGLANNGLALMNIMGQRKAVRMTKADITKAQSSATNMNGATITPMSGTQNIAGYNCKKVMITDPKNPNTKTIVYVCNNVSPESGVMVDEIMKKLSGFPLGFEVNSNDGSKIKLFATEVSTKLPKKADFIQTVPEGYEETSMDEMREELDPKTGQ